MNIYQRLNEIKKKIGYIQKDKKVESYMAVTHDAVTAETRQHFIDCGVLIVPNEINNQVIVTAMTTGRGTPFIRFEAKYRIDFVNVDEPTEKVSVEFSAHALDHGDKAPGKAHSYATKYAVLKVLQLETGEEEESREVMIAARKKAITPMAGAADGVTAEQKAKVESIYSAILDCFAEGWEPGRIVDMIDKENLDTDERVYLASLSYTKQQKSALKKAVNAKRELEKSQGENPNGI